MAPGRRYSVDNLLYMMLKFQGNLCYTLVKLSEPNSYLFFELFDSQASKDEHDNSPHLTSLVSSLIRVMPLSCPL